MDHLCLIDVTRLGSYEKCCRGEKWLPRNIGAIVIDFPTNGNEKYVEFCWTNMVL